MQINLDLYIKCQGTIKYMNKDKIGVFGDSFADYEVFIQVFAEKFKSPIVMLKNKQKMVEKSKRRGHDLQNYITSWIDLIGAKSYGYGGTDIQYSFLKFEKNHSKYDQVIFVLTEPLRLTLGEDILTIPNPNSNLSAERLEKEALEHYKKSASIKHLEMYHTWGALRKILEVLIPTNQEYVNRQHLFYNLVIERIKQLRPDVKFIKAFSNHDNEFPIITDPMSSKEISEILNLFNRTVPSSNKCLKEIQLLENLMMGTNNNKNLKYDARVGHLTEESHRILAPLIKKWLKTDEMFFDFDIKEFHNIKPDRNRYYTSFHKSYEDWKEYYLKDKND